MGSDSMFDDSNKLWADGPFCPSCLYELDRDYKEDKWTTKNRWMCVKCNKNFSIPKNIEEDTREKVIKIFEAELRKSHYEKQTTKN